MPARSSRSTTMRVVPFVDGLPELDAELDELVLRAPRRGRAAPAAARSRCGGSRASCGRAGAPLRPGATQRRGVGELADGAVEVLAEAELHGVLLELLLPVAGGLAEGVVGGDVGHEGVPAEGLHDVVGGGLEGDEGVGEGALVRRRGDDGGDGGVAGGDGALALFGDDLWREFLEVDHDEVRLAICVRARKSGDRRSTTAQARRLCHMGRHPAPCRAWKLRANDKDGTEFRTYDGVRAPPRCARCASSVAFRRGRPHRPPLRSSCTDSLRFAGSARATAEFVDCTGEAPVRHGQESAGR